jgi:hypothetical protein
MLERCGPLELKGFGQEEAWYLVDALRERTPTEPPAEVSKARA